MTITCSGTQLTLEVDTVQLAKTDDLGPVPGDVVLFAGLRDTGTLVVDFAKVIATQP